MSLHDGFTGRSNYPVAAEFGVVTAVLIGVALWQRLARLATAPLSEPLTSVSLPGGFPASGLVTSGLFVAGLGVIAGAYAASRDITVGSRFPSRAALPALGLAGTVPVVLVATTELVGLLTGVPYSTLTMTYYGTGGASLPVLVVIGLGTFVAVPSLVLVCQVLVQESFGRVVDGGRAAFLTTFATGFAMLGHGGLSTVPERGKLVGAVLFVVLLAVGRIASESGTGDRVRSLAYLPVVSFVALVVVSGVAEVDSLAGGLFALTHLAVLGVAAVAYERTGSLLPPAAAYLSLSLANAGVVLVVEGGGVAAF